MTLDWEELSCEERGATQRHYELRLDDVSDRRYDVIEHRVTSLIIPRPLVPEGQSRYRGQYYEAKTESKYLA